MKHLLLLPLLFGVAHAAPITIDTPQAELGQKALQALRAGDVEAYVKLLPDPVKLGPLCPKSRYLDQHKRARRAAKIRSKFAECLKLGDLTKAKLVGVEMEPDRTPLSGCSPGAFDIEDVRFWLKDGDKIIEIRVDDPIELSGAAFVTDAPRCKID